MQDVTAWLHGLGLAKYAKAFQEHEIDLEALPDLSEKNLEEIGMPVGPRVKVLAAISEMTASSTSSSEARPEHFPTTLPKQRREAERRQITVMFCDLVDSTKLATRLDAEDLRSVMREYQQACATVIESYEGHVAQYLGDGVMAYFGWPIAHEGAAEQAVRAGLGIVESVAAIAGSETLSVRIGISTGIVVIGESGSGDPSTPAGAVGETPYLAARLQSIATANSVVISEATSRLVSTRFDQEDLGPQHLKGVVEPMNVFRVRGVREDSNRFQAEHTAALTPLVDRRAELALLQQCWRDAKEGDGQVVIVSGVPGIGKSRIVYELKSSIKDESKFVLKYQCSPHFMQSPLFPVIQQLEGLLNLDGEASDQGKLDKIERIVSPDSTQTDKLVPLLAEMLSIKSEQRGAPLGLTAQQIKAQTLLVLVQHLLDLAAKGPVFCLLEDTQWIDPSTRELLDLVVKRIDRAPILLVITHRPEHQVQLGAYGNVSAITLSRLSRRDAATMAQFALRDRILSSAPMARIVEESDYIPLFVEELARGATESVAIGGKGTQDRRAEPSASWSVPDSLRDSLVARLDSAPQARRVAQMAAVVGRDFSYDLLLRISSMSSPELDAALAHLEQKEIIQQINNRQFARYSFKHALVRDAAYESLLRSRRREIHARVAAALEKEWPEIVAGQPELLAYHYGLAGEDKLAVRYWLMGGHRAQSRSAYLEATDQFQQGLEILESIPKTPELNATELEIYLSLGHCLIAARGYSANETRKSFERACTLSAQLMDPHKEIQAMFGLWGHYWMRAQHDRAIELSEAILAKAEETGDPVLLEVGHRSLGSTLFTLGEFVRAQECLKRTMSLAQQSSADNLSKFYVVDPRIAAQLMLAWNCWILGYPLQARDNVLQALEQATEQADPYSIAFAQYVTSAVLLFRGEPQASLDNADQSLALSREHRINLYALYAQFGRGCALAALGQETEGLIEIREGVEEARRSNLGYMRGFMLGWLAIAQAATGELETALSTIDEALRNMNDVAGRAWEAEIRRLRGDFLLAAHPEATDDVERSYADAISVAQSQQARSLELRATTSLARLLRDQGRIDEAQGLLAPIYGWFTEGFDTADLKAAKALLRELG